nr:hypothetical protein [Tanacetum cinerariifolium]
MIADSIATRRALVSMHNANLSASFGKSRVSSQTKPAGMLVSCVKTSDATLNNKSNGSLEKTTPRGATFPSGCEELVAGVCDETQIAELKIKSDVDGEVIKILFDDGEYRIV